MAPRRSRPARTSALMFGRERNGLENHEVALADQIITLPVNPAFASLNLAQAVVIVAYEWFKLASGGALPFGMPQKSQAAPRQQLLAFFANLERELEKVEFFRPPDKRETCRSICATSSRACSRRSRTSDAVRRDHVDRRRPQGTGRGGVLDSDEAGACAHCLRRASRTVARRGARAGARACRGFCGAIRPMPNARCGTRLTKDRRFAGLGFKRRRRSGRTSPISSRFSCGWSSTSCRTTKPEAAARAARRRSEAWLPERGYRVDGSAGRSGARLARCSIARSRCFRTAG